MGRPAVILEAGLDATHSAWRSVQPTLARRMKTCSYDRLRGRRTANADLRDLHGLLMRRHVRTPYVLVGHSFGGMLAYLYATRYRRDVSGLVLVDSEAPWQKRAFLVALGRPRRGEAAVARRLRAFLSRPQRNGEGIDVDRTFAEARSAGRLGQLPLVVIQAGLENNEALPPRLKFLLDRTWFVLQTRLADLSAQHIHVVAATSGHDVIAASGQPELVVAAVEAVAASVREHRPLPSCSDAFAQFAAQCVSG
jgi:pimeloyl-ACP methyl ester carboxylesterase